MDIQCTTELFDQLNKIYSLIFFSWQFLDIVYDFPVIVMDRIGSFKKTTWVWAI